MAIDLTRRRENVPDPEMVADFLIKDLRDDPGHTGQGRLDAFGSLDGLTYDDVCAVALVLARRLAE